MQEFSLAELSYLIQEGRANLPEIRELLVRNFAPALQHFTSALLGENADRTGNALALTAETFKVALNDAGKFQSYDTPQTWLFSVALETAGRLESRRRLLDSHLPTAQWVILLLKYGFQLPIAHAAEIIGKDVEKTTRLLRKSRDRFKHQARPRGREHIGEWIEDAVDGLLPWSELDRTDHFKNCAACQDYLGELQETEKRIIEAFNADLPAPLSTRALENLVKAVDSEAYVAEKPRLRFAGREAWWIVGAISVFIALSLALNPIWTPPPATPSPVPTIPPAESLGSQFRDSGYPELETALLSIPVPLWEPGRAITGDWTPTTQITFSRDGKFAAFGSEDIVVLWDLVDNVQTPLGGHTEKISDLAFSNDTWLATADRSGVLRIWEIASQTTRYFLSEEEPIRTFAFTRDGRYLAAASRNSVFLWQFASPELIRISEIPQSGATILNLSDDAKLLALVDDENTVTIWDLTDSTLQLRFDTGLDKIQDLQFSPAGNRIAAVNYDGHIQIIGLSRPLEGSLTATKIVQLDHPAPLLDMAWLERGAYIAALAKPETDTGPEIFLWEMTTGLPAALPFRIARSETVNNLTVSRAGTLITGDSNGTITFPYRIPRPEIPLPTEFNQSKTDVFPTGVTYRTSPDPLSQTYEAPLEEIARRLSLRVPLAELIPPQYSFIGARYDEANKIASFAFSIMLTPSREERLVLSVRSRSPGTNLDFQEDWIGEHVNFQHVQIGRYLAELVTGEWVKSDIDNGVEGIFRWQESALTRFRWTQNNFLYEIISDSTVSTETGRRNRLFQPLAVALISADDQIPMFDYAVKEGDTCFAIAARFGTTVGRLTTLNNLNAECTIFTDQILTIPVPPPLGVFAQSDLDCNGADELLRLIPDPLQPNTDVYFGIVIDALPEAGNDPSSQYATYAGFSIADIDVTFFGPPQLIEIDGACGKLIALTGYGGNNGQSGIRFFVWTGETLRQVLGTDGFPDQELPGTIVEGFTFTTQRLEYDSPQAACNLFRTTYLWDNNAFKISGEELIPGVACFDNTVIP